MLSIAQSRMKLPPFLVEIGRSLKFEYLPRMKLPCRARFLYNILPPSQIVRAVSDRSRTQSAVSSRAHKPSHAGTRRDWTRRNGYHTPLACRETRDKTWQNAAERDITWKDREMPGNTHASRPTTDHLQVLLRPLTYCHVLLRSPRFTMAY